ncbi:MAG: ABC1 kinase family protein [Anaerolineales bacterium]
MVTSRYRRIVFFFARAVASLVVWELILPRVGLRGWARRTRSDRLRRIAARFRALAIRMGGVLIKVGQFLSSRLDVLPEEITSELAGLQDEVPPEAFADIRRMAEAELGASLAEKFAEFDEAPLAAASLGQAHRARLKPSGNSEEAGLLNVVVKVQRPHIEQLIATDLAALRTVGGWLKRYPPIRKRADVPALLAEFTRILHEEIDYLAEGRNAETFAAHFQNQSGVRVPRVVWTHTTRRVLTLEDVYAIKITDYEAITAAGIDRAEVAVRLFETYLRQIFEDGFFHADPHPGNLFVSARPVTGPNGREGADGVTAERGGVAWQLIFVDFGMVGRVPQSLRAGLRELVIAVGTRDAARMVMAYQLLGVLLPSADLALLERAEAKVFERVWGKSMTELRQIGLPEMQEFTREFRGLIYSMPFQIPEDLILLGRTVAILSGMCTGLNPHFNVWEGLAPFAQKLIAQEAASGWDLWLDEAGKWFGALLGLPPRLDAMLGRMERGELSVGVPQLTEQVSRLELAVRQVVGGVIFAALLAGGVQLYLVGQILFGSVLLVGAGISLAWIIFASAGRR